MYHEYFKDFEVKSEFHKEYVSLWSGWLGNENSHKLEEVTENEWQRFHDFLLLVEKNFKVYRANCTDETLEEIVSLFHSLDTYQSSLNKDYTHFYKFVIPEIGCAITEEWDYTYIIWYRNSNAVKTLSPFIEKAKLCHFS